MRTFVEGIMRASVRLAMVIGLATAGCSKGCGAQTAPVADSAPSAPSAAAAKLDAAIDGAAGKIGPEQMRQYADALKRGRTLTLQKKYPAAIAAFGDALAALPHDGRATSERGYAKLLSGDAHGAEADFDAALHAVPKEDKKLRAQIYFNLGLVNEKEGDGEEAQTDFRASYEYNPTPQAKAKMSTCPVDVEAIATERFATRKEALAQKSLTTEGDGASDLACEGSDPRSCYAILPVKSGVVAVDLGSGVAQIPMNMDPGDTATVEKEGDTWLIAISSKTCGRLCGCSVAMCGPDDMDSCTAQCADAGATDFMCGSLECVDDSPHRRIWVDASSGAGLWEASWDAAFSKDVETKVEDGKLHVTGAGCAVVRSPAKVE